MKVRLMRIDDAVSHTAIGGKIGNPYLAQQTYSITLKTGLVDDTGILQDLLLETDPAQQFTLFTLGSMIFKVFTEVTLVTSLSDSITHGWQLHVHHVLKLGYEFVEAQVEMVPQNYITLEKEEDMAQMRKLLDGLEDNDDVQAVWHNWENEADYEG